MLAIYCNQILPVHLYLNSTQKYQLLLWVSYCCHSYWSKVILLVGCHCVSGCILNNNQNQNFKTLTFFSTSVTPGKTTATLLPRTDAGRAEQVLNVSNIKHVSDITTRGTSSGESASTRWEPLLVNFRHLSHIYTFHFTCLRFLSQSC